MSDVTPKVAEATTCNAVSCNSGPTLVRGERISFVSVEQVYKTGKHKLNPHAMPSDIRIPSGYVLVHDPSGNLFDKCDIYIVKWHRGGVKTAPSQRNSVMSHAREYYGENAPITLGSVEVPKGPWKKTSKISFIRYFRWGYDKRFEHEYAPPVDLLYCPRPLAWRLPLPSGCVVDSRGFVWP